MPQHEGLTAKANQATLAEAGEIFSVSRQTLWGAAKRGAFPSRARRGKSGSERVVNLSDVEAWLDTRPSRSAAAKAKVAAGLLRRGYSIPQIALELEVSTRSAQRYIRAAGLARSPRFVDHHWFAQLWNGSASIAECAVRAGLTRAAAVGLAKRLRKRGFVLRPRSRWAA